MRSRGAIAACALLVSSPFCWLSDAEFVYYDFNGTTGLVLNGNAATSSCAHIVRNKYVWLMLTSTMALGQPPCLDEHGTEMKFKFEFDYNQQSMLSTASHAKDLYSIDIYPDTTPWAKRQTYFAAGQQIGLVS